MIISGDSADVALAYELVEELVAAEAVRLDLEDGLHAAQTTIRVPGSLVGGLMGQRGERIMHIERLCGAKVDLSRRLKHDTREIRISSRDAASVQQAVEMIQTAVNRRGGSEVQSQPAPVERAAAHRSAKTKLTDWPQLGTGAPRRSRSLSPTHCTERPRQLGRPRLRAAARAIGSKPRRLRRRRLAPACCS